MKQRGLCMNFLSFLCGCAILLYTHITQATELTIFTDITIPEIVRNAGYRMDDLEPVLPYAILPTCSLHHPGADREAMRETAARWLLGARPQRRQGLH